MNDIHTLDTVSDRESAVPVGLQASETPRRPWHKPQLRRSDVSLSTRFVSIGVHSDLTANGS